MTSSDECRSMPPREGPRGGAPLLVSLAAALPVSIGVALLTSRLIDFRLLGPWGLLYGFLALPAAFGLSLLLLKRRVRLGWLSLGLAAGLLSMGAWWWIISWGVPITTLEGLWLWPLALGTLALGTLSIMRSLRNPDR